MGDLGENSARSYTQLSTLIVICWLWHATYINGCHHILPASATTGVPQRQPHRRSGLATLPSVGAVP